MVAYLNSDLAKLGAQMESFEKKLDKIAKGLKDFSYDVSKNFEHGKEWRRKHQQWIESVDLHMSILVERKVFVLNQLLENLNGHGGDVRL